MEDSFDFEINALAKESTLGALGVAKKAGYLLLSILKSASVEDLEEYCKKILATKPTMVSLFTLVDRLLLHPEKGLEWIDEYLTLLDDAEMRIPEYADQIVQVSDRIMTNSFSYTSFAIFKYLVDKDPFIMVAESLPGCEGEKLSHELEAVDISSASCVDAAALTHLQKCQKIIIGADNVTKTHFANKIGSFALALGAREFGIPLYVGCDTTKYLPFDGPWIRHMPEEDPIFEATPLTLVKGVITEQGIFSPDEFLQKFADRKMHHSNLLPEVK